MPKPFVTERSGVSAIEFGLTAPIFFALVLGILEAGLALHIKNQMFGGMMEASRLLKTGAIQSVAPEDRPEVFLDAICATTIIPACQERLLVQAQPITDDDMASMVGADGIDQSALIFDTGSPETLLGVEVAYRLMPGFIGPIFGSTTKSDGETYLTSMTIFRAEPY